jgi:predicted ATPase
MRYLLIIGAYRDNEVDSSHPLTMILKRIEKQKEIHHIFLEPLELSHVKQLVSDTFRRPLQECHNLGQLTLEKTQGNPFFIIIFLTNLVHQNIVHFNHTKGTWEWDLTKIQGMDITDNVVHMTTQRIQRLDKKTQSVLSLAAAIGNQFDLKTLSVICKKPIADTIKLLWPAIKGLFLLRLLLLLWYDAEKTLQMVLYLSLARRVYSC